MAAVVGKTLLKTFPEVLHQPGWTTGYRKSTWGHWNTTSKAKRTRDSSHLHGQQNKTGHNKERQKSQPPRRRNQEESSKPVQKELNNRIQIGESSRRYLRKRNCRSNCEGGNTKLYVTYSRTPKSPIKKDNRKESIRKWRSQWEETTKWAITKELFPSVDSRLAVNLNLSPNVTTIMTGQGNTGLFISPWNILKIRNK